MIKTFLKHWVYELCIQQYFNAFNRNFNIFKHIRKVGDKFNSITLVVSEEQEIVYKNPVIVRVDKDSFTIRGKEFDEYITDDMDTLEIFEGGDYKVTIYPGDRTTKYYD